MAKRPSSAVDVVIVHNAEGAIIAAAEAAPAQPARKDEWTTGFFAQPGQSITRVAVDRQTMKDWRAASNFHRWAQAHAVHDGKLVARAPTRR